MEAVQCSADASDLEAQLAQLPLLPRSTSLGADIDAANRVLLDPTVPVAARVARFRVWASQHQPCMFGRLGARGQGGIGYDLCWVARDTLQAGSEAVSAQIQQARRAWKARASQGLSHGFLVVFNAPELAYAQPGSQLLRMCQRLCDLFLVEHAPVSVDTIYTESVPLRGADGSLTCLKGGMNVFYGTAHRTRNHDRRIPAGVVVSVNSPGLLAHSLVSRGIAPDLATALDRVRRLAWASIGHGGISGSRRDRPSCSWHNLDAERPTHACPMKQRPGHVPENFSTDFYSAHYHTDVLLPSEVMEDARLDPAREAGSNWPRLDFEYLSTTVFPSDHESFGFVHGRQVSRTTEHRHTWAPREPEFLPAPETQP
jgi:hypothetical protein